MTPVQNLGVAFGALGSTLVVAGLVRRGTIRTAHAFGLYHAWLLAGGALVALWPARFYAWGFWSVRMLGCDLLELSALIELAWWTFAGFPGAAARARALVLALLVATCCAVMMLPLGPDFSGPLLGALRARLEIGTAWGFAALAALVLYYDIPVRPIHRAIVLGLVIKLVVFGQILEWLAQNGPALEPVLNTAHAAGFSVLTCWWAWAAWKREAEPSVDLELAAMLQPWRAR